MTMLPRLNRSKTSVSLFNNDLTDEPGLILYSKKYSNLYLKRAQKSRRSERKVSPQWAGEDGELDKRYNQPEPIPIVKWNSSQKSLTRLNGSRSVSRKTSVDRTSSARVRSGPSVNNPSGCALNWCSNYAFSSLQDMHCQSLAKQQQKRPESSRSIASSRGKINSATSFTQLSPQSLEEHKRLMDVLEEQHLKGESEKLQRTASRSSLKVYGEVETELSVKTILVLKWLEGIEEARQSNSLVSVMGY